jgi:Superfamily I DNA and RNA helicases
MTIHSAKGLEFRNVFVVGLEENLFPSSMAGDSPRAMEEERRLFYVAITRAEDHCFLSFAKSRFRYGKMEFANPSRFLRDIDPSFLKLPTDSVSSRHIDESPSRFRREQNDRPARSLFNTEREAPKPAFTKVTIPRNLTKMENAQPKPASGGPITDLQSGQHIEHERFGIGEVLKVEGSGENLKATVKFRNAGEKQLLLKFARFKVIS